MKNVVAFVVAIGAVVFLGGRSGVAQPLPWCVESDGGNYIDCSYYTHRQCLLRASGDGPCVRNSAFDWYYRARGLVPPLDLDPHPRSTRPRRR